MDATLEAVKRRSGKNEARRLRAAAGFPPSSTARKDGKAPEGVRRRRSQGGAADPALRLGRQHADQAQAGWRSRRACMVREYQLDPVTHDLLHADFYQLAMDKAIVVTVPIVVKGEAKGVKQQGGMLDFVTREIEVECLPADIPERITVDVSELMLHESIRVRDLPVDPKWKAVSDGETMLVHVVMPKAEEEPAAATAEAAAAAPRRGRARGHQEGQDRREGREKRQGQEVEAGHSDPPERREADRWSRQPRTGISRYAPQRRVHGRRRDRAAAWHRLGLGRRRCRELVGQAVRRRAA